MTTEIWKSVEGFAGYEVSNQGRVRSSKYKTPRILKLTKSGLNNTRYYKVMLRKEGKSHCKMVHRLVAECFCPGSGQVVMHLDNDMFNNRADNLRWGTQSENIKQGWCEGRITGGQDVKSFTWGFYSPSGVLTAITNLASFCRENNLDRNGMDKVAKGKRKSHKGWTAACCAL